MTPTWRCCADYREVPTPIKIVAGERNIALIKWPVNVSKVVSSQPGRELLIDRQEFVIASPCLPN
eukprot:6786466-Pyramimonas_sp.AAC.1